MNPERHCPGLEELNAYVDGELDASRRAQMEGHLAQCPEDARRVSAYRRGDEALRAAFDELCRGETLSEGGRRRLRRRRRWVRIAGVAASAVLAAGIALGAWWLHSTGAPGEASDLARDATAAYRLYAVQPPATGTASPAPREREELSRWLSERIGRPMRVPELADLGFRLVDVRLLPGAAMPAAQLVYGDRAGRKVSCYFVARRGPDQEQLRYARSGSVNTFYRVDDDLGYAVSGEVNRTELRAIAEAAYRSSEGRQPVHEPGE